jgi:hypothetical protein
VRGVFDSTCRPGHGLPRSAVLKECGCVPAALDREEAAAPPRPRGGQAGAGLHFAPSPRPWRPEAGRHRPVSARSCSIPVWPGACRPGAEPSL